MSKQQHDPCTLERARPAKVTHYMQVEQLQHWLSERLPANLTVQPPQITIYDDEIVIVLHLDSAPTPCDNATARAAAQQTIAEQRESSRRLRMRLAKELQTMTRLPVAWGMRCGDSTVLFTTRTVPVMTRLGRVERDVLDTLVAAGVADTRSSALAYTVRAFAAQHADWLAEVRQAIDQVRQVRSRLSHPRAGDPPDASEV